MPIGWQLCSRLIFICYNYLFLHHNDNVLFCRDNDASLLFI